jgi:glycosyltransferase involved in cell wall biosynthesis
MLKRIMKNNFVTYQQPVPKEQLLNIYRENDIFVMPSRTETFGLVYAEAISQGLPVVYSVGQGFDGQFQEGEVGYHVVHDNPHDIADKVIMILGDYQNLSAKCVSSCVKFDWKRISEHYRAVYEAVAGGSQ